MLAYVHLQLYVCTVHVHVRMCVGIYVHACVGHVYKCHVCMLVCVSI